MENLVTEDYLAKGTIGNVAMPGAPIAAFSLLVMPKKNVVTGTVILKQTENDPENDIAIQVKGKINVTRLGQFTKVVSLQGQYRPSLPKSENGSFLADFDAYFAIDNCWEGTGGFSCHNHQIENEPVALAESLKEEFGVN
ncbi:DUF1842 domain-containing protein [Flavobacterium poyangense]|uniref:DUF1842 domain-containing protein n=1 Tax=Flavobacterium poyangense TaxID=2204302 RepID=UPI0014228EDE|nr:DUF1842 domain-containing protein [Flavobacterium sp. JXAS1]